MTEPTDDELDAVIAKYQTRIYPQDMHPRFERAIMRAAIAKWGTPQAVAGGEPVYAFRRKGLDDFCTCDAKRYEELSAKPNLFEVRVFYTAPPPQAVREPLPTDVELMKTISKAVRGLTMHRNGTTSIRIAKAVLEEYGYLYPPPKKDAETL